MLKGKEEGTMSVKDMNTKKKKTREGEKGNGRKRDFKNLILTLYSWSTT